MSSMRAYVHACVQERIMREKEENKHLGDEKGTKRKERKKMST